MTRRSLSMIVAVAITLVLTVERRSSGSVSGNANPSIGFDAVVRAADGREQYRFLIDIEPVMFRLLTVQNKYSLVRLRMQNATTSALALSADSDRLELISKSGAPVPAVLNLQRGNATFWDGLDAGTREALAYPTTLKGVPAAAAGVPQASPETLYFYAFFPAAQVLEAPAGFAYTIASLGQTIRIEHRAASAR